MIRTENEYREIVRRLTEEKQRLDKHRAELVAQGLSPSEVKNLMDPLLSFHAQLNEEAESYERLRRGDFGEFENLRGIGQLLVALRIFQRVTQAELAKRLGVSDSQVCRDERNEYHGITLERASRVLEALGVRLTTRVEVSPMPCELDEAEAVGAKAGEP